MYTTMNNVAAVTMIDIGNAFGEIIPKVNQIAQFTENRDTATSGMTLCIFGARYMNGNIRQNWMKHVKSAIVIFS